MIDKAYGRFELSCDICGEVVEERFDNFQDAVDYKKSNGWKSRKCEVVWQDECPDCQ